MHGCGVTAPCRLHEWCAPALILCCKIGAGLKESFNGLDVADHCRDVQIGHGTVFFEKLYHVSPTAHGGQPHSRVALPIAAVNVRPLFYGLSCDVSIPVYTCPHENVSHRSPGIGVQSVGQQHF